MKINEIKKILISGRERELLLFILKFFIENYKNQKGKSWDAYIGYAKEQIEFWEKQKA